MPAIDYTRDNNGKRSWELLKDWSHQVNGYQLHIPQGFRFDLASVPRILWPIPGFAPNEIGAVAAPLLHDFIYRHAGRVPLGAVVPLTIFTRRQADRYFRISMLEEGIPTGRRNVAWLAVRLAGWWPWLKAARRRSH